MRSTETADRRRCALRARTVVAVAVAAALALGPVALLLVWSFARAWYWPALLPRAWSLRAWEYLLYPGADLPATLGTSAGIALLVAALAVLVGAPAGRALALHEFRGKQAVLFALMLPILAPPLASAMGVHALFLWYGLADTAPGVALVHLIPAVPYATLVMTGSFSAFDPDLEAQARTLGASPLAVVREVTIPAVAPGLAIAAVFAFVISWSQYLLTLFVGGGRVRTLPLSLVAFQRSGDEAIAAALSLVFLAPPVVAFLVAARYLQRGTEGDSRG